MTSSTSPDLIISARGLTKQFTVRRRAVDAVTDLDLDVRRGELIAFLGPNGAGKSTSLRMLTTLLPPTRGSALVAGFDIARQPAEVRRRIGYIGQGSSAGSNQRVRDELLSQGAFYGMSRRAAASRAGELLDSLDLAPLATRSVQGLSGGQKRRLDIAMGLIHSPSLLFLDEPSTGLDPQSRANLWQHLLALREQHGTTIFVTTHYLEEADQFAERVLVMDHGRVIADDHASALKSTLAGDVIELGFGDTVSLDEAAAVASRIAGRPAARVTGASPEGGPGSGSGSGSGSHRLDLTVDHGERLVPVLLRELDAAGLTVTTVTLRQPTLDDVFLALTGRSLRDSAAAGSPSDPGATVATLPATTTPSERIPA